MATNTKVKLVDTMYKSHEYDRITSAPPHDSKTIIKYIIPRVIKPSTSNDSQGALRKIGWPKNGSNYPVAAKTHGLASLVQNATFPTVSPLHSINGERIIDEQRELSQLTEILGNTIVRHSSLLSNNHFLELLIQWFQKYRQDNGLIIEKMYKTEIESAKVIIRETLQQKAAVEKKCNDATKLTKASDIQYEQLLLKRNKYGQELFEYERKIAQNNAECQFLQRRLHHFDEENKFYLLKNKTLHDRKVRLRYELDEEIFSQHTLHMEREVLGTEKITTEDVHLTAFDALQNSINVTEIGCKQAWLHFTDQLNDEVQRIRSEYEKKLDIYREELHRNFEYQSYHFEMHKSTSTSNLTKEHRDKLEQYLQEKNETKLQLETTQANVNEMTLKINELERRIAYEKQNHGINVKQKLETIQQTLQERERKLEEALRDRVEFKHKIEIYKAQLDRDSRQKLDPYYNKRSTIHEVTSSLPATDSPSLKAPYRLSWSESKTEKNEQKIALPPPPPPPQLVPTITESKSNYQETPHDSSMIQNEESLEEGTLTRFADFNSDLDCNHLYILLTNSHIEEVSIIKILCNRSIDQRLEIRDRYKQLFRQNLGDALEKIKDDALSKLLRILLLSAVDRDCFELRRILKTATVDENILAEILFSRPSQHMQTVRNRYKKLFKNTLEQDLITDRDTSAKKLFLSIMQVDRPEHNYIDEDTVLKDARELSETGTVWKQSQSPFIALLCNRSNEQLKNIFAAYQQFAKIDIEQAIQIHTEGDLTRILMAIVRIIRNRPRFFAFELKRSFKGTATNNDNLNRIIVSRCEIDAAKIKNEFEKITKHTLHDYLLIHTTKNYRVALLELLRHRIELHSAILKIEAWKQETKLSSDGVLRRVGVRWQEPITKDDSDESTKQKLVRSTSDRSMEEKRYTDVNQPFSNSFDGEFDNNNQTKARSISTIYAKTSQSQQLNRHSFAPMPRTYENQ
ncbi:unnamed protein product [Rotaria magnacalcarata]|uniref:Annexin n=3 Tax=Rotaria magnacalcarata TaxID=392030 RepID=A0A814EYV0_9BILA|nr:unnamed protein product [Rotaria magnacalcarata]CAF1337873.1 unnamed protein product [Rotaria magnacalcarata]CAF2048355.1 unnamed protein product [Rotaria magnacalcarata]CAF2078993.1 unnamed protein product [Rotaria magnacalcarata]CAF3730692.1 unnamed protein product [Rotaria magnacalcarata]